MFRKVSSGLALVWLLFAGASASAQVQSLAGLNPAAPITDVDTTWWCQFAQSPGTGCDNNPAHPLVRATAPQISTYILGKLSGTPPLTYNSASGTYSLSFDSTLSIVGGALHVVTSGGGTGAVNQVTGTAGQILVSPTTGNVVVSLPPTITQATNFTAGLQINGVTPLLPQNNLGDIPVPATARSNLGLGPLAIVSSPLPVTNGGTGATGAGATAANNIGALATANNLSELVGTASLARTNLGLGSLALINSPLPVANGGTGTTSAGATAAGNIGALAVSNNLSELTATAATARTNLQLGTMAIQNAASVNITGATAITGLPTPVNPSDAATKLYVDSSASGIPVAHTPVRLATAAALPANTAAGACSTATLTENANGALTVDGVAANTNDRVLIKNEAAPANNGIYTVTATGSGAAVFVLTRASDFNTVAPGNIAQGANVLVTAGSSNINTQWSMNTSGTITCGTTGLTWVQTAAASTGITGPVSSNIGFVPQWSGTGGNVLSNGLAVATTAAANSLVETGAGGTISATFLPTVPVAQGGTGATAAGPTAAGNIGALAVGNNLSELTATAATARTNLGLGSIAVINSPVPVANGGTGATAAGVTAASNIGALAAGNNLSDLTNTATARSSLGLGSLATINSPVPVANGGTGSTSGGITAANNIGALAEGNNLSDLNNVVAARSNLGLGSVALVNSPVPVANGGTGATVAGAAAANNVGALAIASNLSELTATASTARTNLGLGTIAVQNASAVAVTGGTITGMSNPVNPTDVANKAYVDAGIVGVTYHTQAIVNTGGAVLPNTPTYNNGTAGVGATLTASVDAVLVVNGYTPVLNDRILVKDQATQAQNGIYVLSQVGSGSVPWILTRATDFNTAAVGNISIGAYVFTVLGTTTPASAWALNTSGAITVGTTALTFAQVGGTNGGVAGPGPTTNGFVPTWNGIAGTALNAGFPLATTATASAVVETGAGGTISLTFIPTIPVAQGGTGATAAGATAANNIGALAIANNLSEITSTASTARSNLGLGTAAVQNTGVSGANVPLLNGGNTWSGVQSYQPGDLTLLGAVSGSTVLQAPGSGGGTATFFTGSDTVVGIAAPQTLTNKTLNCVNNTCTVRANLDLTGQLAATNFPILTGDVTTAGGSLATTIPNGTITVAKMATAAQSTTVNGQTCTLGSSCTVTAGGTTTIVAKTANYTIVSADAGTWFTNALAGGTVIFTLPTSPATNQTNCFQTLANKTVEVQAPPASAVQIAYHNVNSAAAGNIQTGNPGNAQLAQFSTVCMYFAASNQWLVTQSTGQWSVN